MSDDFLFGWRDDLEDRDALRAMCAPFPHNLDGASIPDTIDPSWLKIFAQVKNDCVGNGLVNMLLYLNWVDTQGGIVELSRRFAYITSQMSNGFEGRDEGATIGGAIQAAQKVGACREELCPYWEKNEPYSTKLPQEAYSEGKNHKLMKPVTHRSYDDYITWTGTGAGGTIIGIPWLQSHVDCTGIMDREGGRKYGGHCVALLGYITRGGEKWPKMFNSHGEQWGDNGTALIAPRLVDGWCRSGNCEVMGGTDIEEFDGPRPPRDFSWLGYYGDIA